MEIKITYSKAQLERAVEYIATHNSYLLNQRDYIRDSILDNIKDVALNPRGYILSTMGYQIVVDKSFESMDEDENTAVFQIWVDPALDIPIADSDFYSEVIHTE